LRTSLRMRAPLFWLSWPLLLGLLLGCTLAPSPMLPSLAAATLCAALARARARPAPLALACAALLLGWCAPGLAPVGPAVEDRLALHGTVLALRSDGAQLVALRAVAPEGQAWRSTHGRLLVDFGDAEPTPGTRVLAWGQARPLRRCLLPGSPDAGRVAWLAGARARLAATRWAPVGVAPPSRPEPPPCRHRGVLRALALGDRSQLPEGLEPLLRSTGTSHLLAISGLHLGLVAGLLGWLGSRLARLLCLRLDRSRPWLPGAGLMLMGALAYGHLAGWPVSAVRAALMLLGVALALALERGRDPRQLLGLAAFATVLGEPALAATASWQLSFGALLGLVLLAPRLVRAVPPDLHPVLDRIAQGGAATVAATIGTLPAAAWWFQELALTAVPANLVALPLIGLVATPGALLSVALPPPLDALAASVACAALDLSLGWLRLMRGPGLHPAVGPAAALLLVSLPLLARRPFLAALAAMVALGLRLRPAARLVVTFLAVGQGSAVLVEWPDGRRWLVDGGPSSDAVLHHLRRRGLRRLEVVAATHPHPDHIEGLPAVVEALHPEALWVPRAAMPEEQAYADLLGQARVGGARVLLPDDPAVPALHPVGGWRPGRASTNEESLVLLLAHGRHSVLLTGDIEAEAEAALTPMLGPVDVLGVPHHGSGSSSSQAFLAALRPRVAVVSCGQGNRFGHPHPAVLARYRDSLLLRTDLHGTIEISSDGVQLSLRSWLPDRGWSRWDPPAGPYSLSASSVGSSAPTSSAASSTFSSASSVSSRNR
jgi:competence protein ComEC